VPVHLRFPFLRISKRLTRNCHLNQTTPSIAHFQSVPTELAGQYSYPFCFDIVAHTCANNSVVLIHIRKTPGGGMGQLISSQHFVCTKRDADRSQNGFFILDLSRVLRHYSRIPQGSPAKPVSSHPATPPCSALPISIGWCMTAPGERKPRT
jgi:hypothetical protein